MRRNKKYNLPENLTYMKSRNKFMIYKNINCRKIIFDLLDDLKLALERREWLINHNWDKERYNETFGVGKSKNYYYLKDNDTYVISKMKNKKFIKITGIASEKLAKFYVNFLKIHDWSDEAVEFVKMHNRRG